ncbi:MAG: hypothetical protein LQ342_005468 [Letrouitia transgressa]|nr:MAG: hypothetical protein LQ342_005468 [Letrouitia transgressa]
MMDILVQPPSEVQPGITLNPPIVIVLQNSSGAEDSETIAQDTNAYWALASVVSEDGLTALAPPDPDLLSGTLVDSIHEVSENGERVAGYLRFTNLAIQRPGSYRIRISLIQMPPAGTIANPSSSSASGNARNVMSVVTHVIHAHHSASASVIGEHLSDPL